MWFKELKAGMEMEGKFKGELKLECGAQPGVISL